MAVICENCARYVYDDEADAFFCDAGLDEDEMYRFLSKQTKECPFFDFYDEYSIVRKQN